MRNIRRGKNIEEEEESVFVPMTDMTVSFLFIVMILLAFFAVQFSGEDTVPLPTYLDLQGRYETVMSERDQLQNSLETATAKITKLNQTIIEKNEVISQKEQRINELLTLLTTKKLKIDALTKDKEQLYMALDTIKVEITKLNQIIIEKNEVISQKEQRINELNKNIEKLIAEINNLKDTLKEQNPLEAYILRSQTQRLEILEKIEKKLKIEFTNILVEISPENDALRFKGEGLFSSGSRQLRIAERKVVEKLAELLTNAIECHTIGPIGVDYSECNPEGIIIEAVQIEGHTDSQGSAEANIGLSTDRANAAYFAMTKKQTNLLQYRNIRGQPVISVAGYGEMRPVASNETREGKAENRRIDLRLIMYTPNSREQVESIQNNIAEGISIFNESGFNEP